ncbi:hypothetical protein LSH36_247g01062 [Paralvinella palmiformis]|uniref:J domain-containing protein n=1 Tax=Paralvinella palmiformis TaxID=53620 RepID=A0AAD9JL78_9ANNE|nr:hypothetical protein LSH36_247g01062 [Paralvinella palmiformis]
MNLHLELEKCNDSYHRKSTQHRYSTRIKNYYEVLELTPKATGSQIKSAYYRLSKKYHPDKNPSKESKAMFSEISEAYETLGNIRSRRIYDSSQTEHPVRRGHTMSHNSPFPEYKTKRKPPTGRSTIYNFDEFYRQHYGETRTGERLRKAAYEQAMKERRELIEQKNTMVIFILITSLTVLLINFFFMNRPR